MQLVPLQPVPPASVPLLSQLLTHQLIPLPGDSCLKKKGGEGKTWYQDKRVLAIQVSSNGTDCSSQTRFQMQSPIWCLFGVFLGLMSFVEGE